jgi:hypothetical protein
LRFLIEIYRRFFSSLYGKFGQIPNKTMMKIVDTLAAFNDIARNPDYNLKDLIPIDDDRIILMYNKTEECVDENFRTNVILASFVTMYARLRLFRLMRTVKDGGGEILYFDTDSVIWCQKLGAKIPAVPYGECLGDVTNEVSNDSNITRRIEKPRASAK